MFDQTSRYYEIEDASLDVAEPNGRVRVVKYKRRRFLPPADAASTIAEHTVTQGDRLDNITARYLGDPAQFWRVCDANDAMHPRELTEETGRVVRVAVAL